MLGIAKNERKLLITQTTRKTNYQRTVLEQKGLDWQSGNLSSNHSSINHLFFWISVYAP